MVYPAAMKSPINHPALRQRAARSAVRRAVGRLFVSRVTHRAGGTSARVLFDGEYYDVNGFELTALKAGSTPAELGLYPAASPADGTF